MPSNVGSDELRRLVNQRIRIHGYGETGKGQAMLIVNDKLDIAILDRTASYQAALGQGVRVQGDDLPVDFDLEGDLEWYVPPDNADNGTEELGLKGRKGWFTLSNIKILSSAVRASERQSPSALKIKYRDRKVQPTGIDPQGKVSTTKFAGNATPIVVSISKLKVDGSSPSIALDNDEVVFTPAPNQSIPDHPNCRAVEMQFDEHDLFESKPFRVNDRWELLFSDKGELIELRFVATGNQVKDAR